MKVKKIFQSILIFSLLMGSIGIQETHALGTPQIIGINPSSPAQVGSCITVRVKIDWDSEYRSMRIRFGNSGWNESSEIEFERNFCTDGYSPGWYTIRVEAARIGDNDWANPVVTETQFELTGQPEPSKGPSISQFNFSPSSGAIVGDSVNIHIKVDSNNPGATTLTADCGGLSKNETSEVEFDSNWNTNGCPAQTVNILVCSRHVDDPNWTNPTCSTKSYTLSSPQVIIPVPDAQLWADSLQVSSGQCTTLYWQTTNADNVSIDGNGVQKSGSQKVCPTVTKKYSLTATNQSGNANRNLTIVVSNQSAPINVADYFQTRDIIQIGNDIFVIVNGERRLVPNPETLDALCISRNQINNKGFSDSELKDIYRGTDIPDVNIDSSGFQVFKNQYFTNCSPNAEPNQPQPPQEENPYIPSNSDWQVGTRVGLCAGAQIRSGSNFSSPTHTIVPENNWQVDIIGGPRNADNVTWWNISRANIDGGGTGWVYFEQVSSECNAQAPLEPILPLQPTPIVPFPIESTQSETPFFCNWWVIGFLFCENATEAQAAVNTQCITQCVPEARTHRPDIAQWSSGGTSDNILANALKVPIFMWDGQLYTVKVRNLSNQPSEQPQHGDLVVWPSGCDDAWSKGGHIGYVESYSNGTIYITDSNWLPTDKDVCTRRDNQPIPVESCMRFITKPNLIGVITPLEGNKCSAPIKAFRDQKLGENVVSIQLTPLPTEFIIKFDGKEVPDSDKGVKHNGYHTSEEGYTSLGVSTQWIILSGNWWLNYWKKSEKWEFLYPCP